MTHFQIYETVSEGTPCSPVFASIAELVVYMTQPIDRSSRYNRCADWQCSQGYTLKQAKRFAHDGSSLGMVKIGNGPIMDGITAAPILAKMRGDDN